MPPLPAPTEASRDLRLRDPCAPREALRCAPAATVRPRASTDRLLGHGCRNCYHPALPSKGSLPENLREPQSYL